MHERAKHLAAGLLLLAVLPAAAAGLVTAPGYTVQEFPLERAGAHPNGITTDRLGTVWFTEPDTDRIGRLTSDGQITEFPIPTPPNRPLFITVGGDGNLWFTEATANAIGRISLEGEITEFPLPSFSGGPLTIAPGSDGNLWFTEGTFERGRAEPVRVGRITPSGTIAEFTFAATALTITPGPDQNLWFTGDNTLGRITTSGMSTIFPVPGRPVGIAAGPDGALWFTSAEDYQVGRFTTAGAITLYGDSPHDDSTAIIRGPDDNMWFARRSGTISRITRDGMIDDILELPAGHGVGDLTLGGDNAVWFTEPDANMIGRLTRIPGRCAGDCNGDHQVIISELIFAVSVALSGGPIDNCTAVDLDGDAVVRVNELIAAVRSALMGCV